MGSLSMKLPSLAGAAACALMVQIVGAIPAWANSLTELWSRPVRATYDSGKSALALEHCIGSAVSDWGAPTVLHGEGVTEIWVGVPFAIRIKDGPTGRTISFTASGAYDDRVARAIGGCL